MIRNRLLLLLPVLMLCSAGAQASPACGTDTFAYYLTHPCSIGFVNFDFAGVGGAYQFTPDDYNPAAGDVTVTPVGTGLVAGQQVGLVFSNNNFVVNSPAGSLGYNQNTNPFGGSPTCCVAGSQANPSGTGWVSTNPDSSGSGFADLNITFNVSINAPNMALNSTTTQLDVFIYSADSGGTKVDGSETVSDAVSHGQIGGLTFDVEQTGNPTTSTTFSQPTTSVNVDKSISMSTAFANTTPNSAALNSVTETFTFVDNASVPEAGSFMMVGLAALLSAAYRWRKYLFAL